jgi:hypothetical protein
MRAVALVVILSLFATACFPKEPQKRFYSQLGEGGALVGGIVLLTASGTGADCDMNKMSGQVSTMDCRGREGTLSAIGLGLILLGVVGFIATVSTADDDPAPVATPTAPVAPAPPAPPAPATPNGNGN